MDGTALLSARGGRPPVAISFGTSLNGASRPVIAMTTGLRPFVVKFREFAGKHGLMSEAVGAELMAHLGLPVPGWTPVRFTDDLIGRHPEIWCRGGPEAKGVRPRAGLGFGSSLTLSAPPGETYQIIPSAWVSRIANLTDFVGALLVDLWANNCDRRQCLFLTGPEPDSLRAVFIDNDWMFGGHFGNEQTCARRAMAPLRGLYKEIWTKETISYWKGRIDRVGEATLNSIVAAVPPAWAGRASVMGVREELLRRRRILDLLIAEATEAIQRSDPPTWSTPRPALSARPSSARPTPLRRVPA